MSYDLPPSRSKAGVPAWLLAVVALLAVGLGLAAGVTITGADSGTTAPAAGTAANGAAPSATAPGSPSAVSPAPASATPGGGLNTGSDAGGGEAAPQATVTARVFVSGWLSADPERRRDLLAQAATPDLAAELMLTEPAAIPATQLARLEPLGSSEFSAEYVARLRNGTSVLLSLGADPEGPNGWLVENVEPWT